MTDTERRSLVTRGLDDIIPAGLRDSIVGLIEDVRLRGDAAVCDALAKFDHMETCAVGRDLAMSPRAGGLDDPIRIEQGHWLLARLLD